MKRNRPINRPLWPIVLLALALASGCVGFPQAKTDLRVVVVRHAEKASAPATDPALTGVHGPGFARNLGSVGQSPTVTQVLNVARQIPVP